MKKRLFVIIITLIAFCPFIGGLNGCAQGQIPFGGGGIEVPEEEAEIAMAPEVSEEELPVIEEEVPESGPENLLKPEPEEPEKPKDEPETTPTPFGYLPNDADLYIVQDNTTIQTQDTKDSIEQIGYTDNLQTLSQQSAKLLNLTEEQVSIDKLDYVSAACFLPKDTTKIDTTNFKFMNCERFSCTLVFKKDFEMTNLLASAIEDSTGGYIINEKLKLKAIKPAKQVLVFGSIELAPFKGTISDADIDALSMASPSSVILMGKFSAIRMFKNDPLIGLFEPMYFFLKEEKVEPRYILSALEFGKFGKKVKMSTVAKTLDRETVEKMYREYSSFAEYAFAIKELKEKEAKIAPTEETLTPVYPERSLELQQRDDSTLKLREAE